MEKLVVLVEDEKNHAIYIGTTYHPKTLLSYLQKGNPTELKILAIKNGGELEKARLKKKYENIHILNDWFEASEFLLSEFAINFSRDCIEWAICGLEGLRIDPDTVFIYWDGEQFCYNEKVYYYK